MLVLMRLEQRCASLYPAAQRRRNGGSPCRVVMPHRAPSASVKMSSSRLAGRTYQELTLEDESTQIFVFGDVFQTLSDVRTINLNFAARHVRRLKA